MAVCYIATRKLRVRASKKKKRGSRKGNHLTRPLVLKPALSKFMNASKATRADIVRKVWAYARKHKLNMGSRIKNKNALKPLFGTKTTIQFGDVAKMTSRLTFKPKQ